MNFGAEPKKVAILGGLLLVAVVVYFVNSSSSDGNAAYTPRTIAAPSPIARTTPTTQNAKPTPATAANRRQRTLQEFRPSLKPKRGEEVRDPTTIDPTLRLDLLAKLQQVGIEGSHRSLFDFGQAAPAVDPAKAAATAKGPKVPSPIVPVQAAEQAKTAEPPKPVAPPVPLKFYGYINPAGQPQKRAFFVEGDEIHVVNEGDVVKRRYKIVRIGVNSVVVEDTQFGSEQTLPLEEQQPG